MQSRAPACNADRSFRFDLIPDLHFASFVILEATDDFEPTLVFEATFDGPKSDFISDLLRVAGDGMHKLYRHCADYPASGLTTPELAKEYFISHDAGADIYFSGNPGRTVAEIKNENGIRSTIVNYFSGLQASGAFAPRLDGLFLRLRSFLAEQVRQSLGGTTGARAMGGAVPARDRCGGRDCGFGRCVLDRRCLGLSIHGTRLRSAIRSRSRPSSRR